MLVYLVPVNPEPHATGALSTVATVQTGVHALVSQVVVVLTLPGHVTVVVDVLFPVNPESQGAELLVVFGVQIAEHPDMSYADVVVTLPGHETVVVVNFFPVNPTPQSTCAFA